MASSFAELIGTISFVLWFFVQTPQIVKMWKLKNNEDMAVGMIVFWVVADFISMFGLLLNGGFVFSQFFTNVYFFVMDSIILILTLHYNKKNKKMSEESTVTLPSLNAAFLAFLFVPAFAQRVIKETKKAEESEFGQFLGYIAAVCYVGSRVVQIVKTLKTKKAETISKIMCLLSALGNLFYGLAIVLAEISWRNIVKQLPWLLQSWMVMIFDAYILHLTLKYDKKNSTVAYSEI
ncbi:hypothetical protein PCE1_004662 [Barthelona sp. PCE]